MLPRCSYLICAVQRTGSQLLCHGLQDTGVLGIPAEYFLQNQEWRWCDRWGVSGEDAFLAALREEPVTANGVWGARIMWNNFADALSRLRGWPGLACAADVADRDVLAAAFPGLRYVWLRHEDKLRQAISLWRAEAACQYSLRPGQLPAEPPPFDRDAVARMGRFVVACEGAWQRWFAAQSIRPLEIIYEDLATDLDRAISDIAGFLGVTLPPRSGPVRPRLQRQADYHTQRSSK